ncbi:hypothetical protein ACOSQ4_015668 [Xanthoceras sorbifolium]
MFTNLTHLSSLDFSHNQLVGPIPFDVSGLQNLTTINLSYNRLHGPIPSSIFKLVNLTQFELSSNNLSGTLDPYMFAKLKSLKRLNISHNSLSLSTAVEFDTSLEEILRNQNNLRWLDLSDNKIHGHVPNWV